MVSTLALTAAPLEAAPRPVLAMALVREFWNELIEPATVAVDAAVVVPAADATVAAPATVLVPVVLAGGVEPDVTVVPAVPAVLPVLVGLAVLAPDVDKLVVCVPLPAPAAVLT